MNKLLSKVFGGLLFITFIISPMSVFGMEADSSKEVIAVSNLTVNDAVYASPLTTSLQNDDDHGNTFSTATELALNEEGVGIINYPDDVDVFKFITGESEKYVVDGNCQGVGVVDYYIYKSNGERVRCYGSIHDQHTPACPLTLSPNETYYMEIRNYLGMTEQDFSYKIKVYVDDDDFGNDYSSARKVGENEEIVGKINYGFDTDCFKFTADRKGIYSIDYGDWRLSVSCDKDGVPIRYLNTISLNANETINFLVVAESGGLNYKLKVTKDLIQNPSFAFDTEGWYLWTEGGAVASGRRDKTKYEPDYNENTGYSIDCTSKGSALNQIQFNTSGLNVKAGKLYKLSFIAKSEGGDVEPLISLMKTSAPWTNYAKSSTVTIGSEWKSYNIYFTSNKTDNNARLTFFLGNRMHEGGKLYLDSISLREYSDCDIPNPSFDNGVDAWDLWTEGGAVASGARDLEVYNTAPAGYRIDCTSKGTAMNQIQFYTWGINVKANKRYRLDFRAKSEGGYVTPLVSLMKKGSPWTSYATSKQVSIGSEWNTYEVYFDCNTTDSNARITFFLGDKMSDGSKLYLDSMLLMEVYK